MVLLSFYVLSFFLIVSGVSSQDKVECGKPGAPIDGYFKPKNVLYSSNEEVTYFCNEDRFYLIGNKNRTCFDNGTWSGSVPFCGKNLAWKDHVSGSDKNCNPKHLVDNDRNTFCYIEKESNITIDLFVHFAINTIVFTLEPNTNYSLILEGFSGNNKAKVSRLFEQHQFINDEFLKLVSKSVMGAKSLSVTFKNNVKLYDIGVFYNTDLCAEPDTPKMGKFINISSSKGIFSCHKDYFLHGEPYIQCVNGKWNTTEQNCALFQEVPEGWMGCGKPGSPANGKRVIERILENRLIYSCNKGFILDGSSQRICQPNSTWTPAIPKCVKNLANNRYSTGYKTDDDDATCESQDTKFYGSIDLGQRTTINGVQLNFKALYPTEISVFITNNSDINKSTLAAVQSLLLFCSVSNVLPKSPILCSGPIVTTRYVVTYFTKAVNVCEITVFNSKEQACGQADQPLHGQILIQNLRMTTFTCDSGYSMYGPEVSNCVDGVWEKTPLCIIFPEKLQINKNIALIIGIAVISAAALICILGILAFCIMKRRAGQYSQTINYRYKDGKIKEENEMDDDSDHIYEAMKEPIRSYTKSSCKSDDSHYLSPILPFKNNALEKPENSECKMNTKFPSVSNDSNRAHENVYS